MLVYAPTVTCTVHLSGRGVTEPICSLGKIKEVAEEVPDAWNRFEDPDGHSVSCFK